MDLESSKRSLEGKDESSSKRSRKECPLSADIFFLILRYVWSVESHKTLIRVCRMFRNLILSPSFFRDCSALLAMPYFPCFPVMLALSGGNYTPTEGQYQNTLQLLMGDRLEYKLLVAHKFIISNRPLSYKLLAALVCISSPLRYYYSVCFLEIKEILKISFQTLADVSVLRNAAWILLSKSPKFWGLLGDTLIVDNIDKCPVELQTKILHQKVPSSHNPNQSVSFFESALDWKDCATIAVVENWYICIKQFWNNNANILTLLLSHLKKKSKSCGSAAIFLLALREEKKNLTWIINNFIWYENKYLVIIFLASAHLSDEVTNKRSLIKSLSVISYHFPDLIIRYLSNVNLKHLLGAGFRFDFRVVSVVATKADHLQLALFEPENTNSSLPKDILKHPLWSDKNKSPYTEINKFLTRTNFKVDITQCFNMNGMEPAGFGESVIQYLRYAIEYPDQIIIDTEIVIKKTNRELFRVIGTFIARYLDEYPNILNQFSWACNYIIIPLLRQMGICPLKTKFKEDGSVIGIGNNVTSLQKWDLICRAIALSTELPTLDDLADELKNECSHCILELRRVYNEKVSRK